LLKLLERHGGGRGGRSPVATRWVTRASADRLNALFNLPLDDLAYEAGWEIMCCFGERTEEFLGCYETASDLTEDDRFALMAMIICSLDDRIRAMGDDPGLADRLRRQLAADFAVHEWTIYYWALWASTPELDPDPDHIFPVTPLMRAIWCEHRGLPDLDALRAQLDEP
jgi:hypothetical protein